MVKEIFDDFVYAIFSLLDPKPEEKKHDIPTGGEDMPPLETEENTKKINERQE